MPRFVDDRPGPAAGACPEALYTPTPRRIAGAETIDTAFLADAIRDGATPILDFGVGAAVPPHGQLSALDPASVTDMTQLLADNRPGPSGSIIVMASSALDPRGCQAAIRLADAARTHPGKAGAARVLWYRGGEEAWAAAGQAFRDLR